jgi:hypothetical protein
MRIKEHRDYDSAYDTMQHIERVNVLMSAVATELVKRAQIHDKNKLENPEKPIFDKYTPMLRGLTYGSTEYKETLAKMKPALDHHYANNSHHPEYFKDGVAGMTLVDLIEMICDWKAATERHADGSIKNSLDINKTRFKIDAQLAAILINTAKMFGWMK